MKTSDLISGFPGKKKFNKKPGPPKGCHMPRKNKEKGEPKEGVEDTPLNQPPSIRNLLLKNKEAPSLEKTPQPQPNSTQKHPPKKNPLTHKSQPSKSPPHSGQNETQVDTTGTPIVQTDQAGAFTYDGSKPLQFQRYEDIAQLVVTQNKKPSTAYIETAEGPVQKNTAYTGASNIMKRPEVVLRVKYLRAEEAKARVRRYTGPMTEEELDQHLSSIVRRGGHDSATVNAIKELRGILDARSGGKRADKVDPTVLCAHLSRWAGATPEAIVAECGGLTFLLDQFMDVCKLTPEQIIDDLVNPDRHPKQ